MGRWSLSLTASVPTLTHRRTAWGVKGHSPCPLSSRNHRNETSVTKWSAWSFPMDYLGLTDGH